FAVFCLFPFSSLLFFLSSRPPPCSPLFPYTTLFRSLFRRLLAQQAFPTVLVLRASFLPFDLVNYGCGLLNVSWPKYTLASMIGRSEEHTSELQSRFDLVCRLLLEKKNQNTECTTR